MKLLIYLVLLSVFLWFVPLIPYDKPSQAGVICIEYKTVGTWIYEKYQINQASRIDD